MKTSAVVACLAAGASAWPTFMNLKKRDLVIDVVTVTAFYNPQGELISLATGDAVVATTVPATTTVSSTLSTFNPTMSNDDITVTFATGPGATPIPVTVTLAPPSSSDGAITVTVPTSAPTSTDGAITLSFPSASSSPSSSPLSSSDGAITLSIPPVTSSSSSGLLTITVPDSSIPTTISTTNGSPVMQSSVPSSVTDVITVAPTSTAPVTPTGVQIPSTVVSDLAPSDPTFAALAVLAHNQHRANQSAPDVVYNNTLANIAQQVSETCVFADDIPAAYSNDFLGINIADGTYVGAANISHTIHGLWYNSEYSNFLPSYYGEANPDFSNFGNWGHFSQVVWVATAQIGCWANACSNPNGIDSGYFTVCIYSPAGNVGGEYGDNIKPALGGPVIN